MTPTMPEVSKQSPPEWTALGYAQLVQSLGLLTRLGAFEQDSLVCALAVARIIDRGRIVRSKLLASELRQALERYRTATDWSPIPAIERALEEAISIAEAEDRKRAAELENEAKAAAHAAG